VPEAGDNVTVKITGLPSYETITDALDGKKFRGSSITLTAAEVNSGLSLHSSYRGTGQPVADLSLTAINGSGSTAARTAAQSLTITDPPASVAHTVALLTQFMSASNASSSGDGTGAIAPPQHHDFVIAAAH
jgi:hypothetical protein